MDSQKKPAKKPKPPRMTQSEIDDLEFSEDKRLRRLGIDPDGDQVGIYRELKRRIAEQEIPLSIKEAHAIIETDKPGGNEET